MANYTESDRVIALGGVFQGAQLARDIARSGICDAAAFNASRDSLFNFAPESVAGVFGGRAGVATGLQALVNQLETPAQRDLDISRYVVGMMHLGDLLMRDPQAMQELYEDLAALLRRLQQLELSATIEYEQLAKIYQDRISVLGAKIMVRGEPLQLQNPANTSRIRVALLAGVRAAVLWRQAGGKKWQLLLRRKAIAATARELVDENAV